MVTGGQSGGWLQQVSRVTEFLKVELGVHEVPLLDVDLDAGP